MARTAAEILVDRLIDWGVEVIFGLPGDGINGIMEALRSVRTPSGLFRSGTKNRPRLWRAAMQSIPAS